MIKIFFEQAKLFHKGRRAVFQAEEFVLMKIAYPLLNLIFYCLIASFSFKTENLTRWVIGNAFLLCTNVCIFGLGIVFVAERFYGRLRSIIASPCSKLILILASGLYPSIFAIVSSVIGLTVGAFIFKVDFSDVNLLLVGFAIIIAMITATFFGLFLSLFGLISDSMHLILNIVNYLLLIFTGAQFPLEQLPFIFRLFSYSLPLTKSIAAMNALFLHNYSEYWHFIFAELISGLLYILLAITFFKFSEGIARQKGRFDMF